MGKSFVELAIQEAIRNRRRLPLPKMSLVREFRSSANDISLEFSKSFLGYRRDVITFFCAPVTVIAKFWELMIENDKDEEYLSKIRSKEHFRWAFF